MPSLNFIPLNRSLKYNEQLIENTWKIEDIYPNLDVFYKELEKANVKISDADFKDILTPYLPQKEEKADDSKDKKADKKEDKKEETDSTK